MKKYTIVAGVNGAGKTTLYQMDPDLRCDYRVNADEILVELGGDWRNASDILSAFPDKSRGLRSQDRFLRR